MKILVTGGAGFIGSHTADALLKQGHEVRILDALEPPVHTGGPPNWLPAEAELVQGSVLDRDLLSKSLVGVEAVFHFAAYQDYLPDFSRFFHVNSGGTALLYEVLVAQKLPVRRVVVASSQAVYGEGPYACPDHGVYAAEARPLVRLRRAAWDHTCPTCDSPVQPAPAGEDIAAPHTPYGISKHDQERIALTLGRRYGIPSVALRYSIVQGPRQSFHNAYSGALRSFAVRVLTGGRPELFEDGNQQRDFVSVHDVVRANLLALNEPGMTYGAFNAGGDRAVTVRELAQAVIREAGAEVEPDITGRFRLGDNRHIRSDISRLRAFGWTPLVSQEAIVREYLAWAAAQPGVYDSYTVAATAMQSAGVIHQATEDTASHNSGDS